MKQFFIFSALLSYLLSQTGDSFVDGVAAVVEENIVLKSDLNQMVNMMAIQQRIDPNKDLDKYINLREAVLRSMVCLLYTSDAADE